MENNKAKKKIEE